MLTYVLAYVIDYVGNTSVLQRDYSNHRDINGFGFL